MARAWFIDVASRGIQEGLVSREALLSVRCVKSTSEKRDIAFREVADTFSGTWYKLVHIGSKSWISRDLDGPDGMGPGRFDSSQAMKACGRLKGARLADDSDWAQLDSIHRHGGDRSFLVSLLPGAGDSAIRWTVSSREPHRLYGIAWSRDSIHHLDTTSRKDSDSLRVRCVLGLNE